MIRRTLTIIGIAAVALSILAACSNPFVDSDDSSSGSFRGSDHYFTKGEIEEDFINWLCPSDPRRGKYYLKRGPNPIAGPGWSVTIETSPQNKQTVTMREATGIWVGDKSVTESGSADLSAVIRGQVNCR